jgi:hypothetical protein
MKFIIEYGCEVCTEHLAIEAENLETAMNFAESEAWRLRDGYGGLHGVIDYTEFCEENELDEDNEDSWEEYADMVRNELEYGAEVFDENNEAHITVLEECEGKFFRV